MLYDDLKKDVREYRAGHPTPSHKEWAKQIEHLKETHGEDYADDFAKMVARYDDLASAQAARVARMSRKGGSFN